MVRKLEKRISRYCDFGENWEAEKLFHAELSEVYTYCNKRSVAWEGLSEFHAWIYPSHQKSDNTLSTFRKGPLQIFTLCGTGDAPNTCPSDILRPPQVMGKEVWDAEDFQVPESQVAWSLVSSPQWCLMGDEHVEKSSKERVPEFGMMEEKNLHGPTRRYTNAAWRFYVHVEKLEIHQFNQSIKQSIKFEPGWVITVQDACGHSLNIQLNEVLIWKDWSNSCPCIFYAKTGFSQGFVSPQFLLMLLFANRNSLGLAVFCRAGLPIDVLWSDASTVLPIASSWP